MTLEVIAPRLRGTNPAVYLCKVSVGVGDEYKDTLHALTLIPVPTAECLQSLRGRVAWEVWDVMTSFS